MTNYSLTTAPVTKQGESPLAVAVRERNLDMIRCLVNECNVNVNGESSVGLRQFFGVCVPVCVCVHACMRQCMHVCVCVHNTLYK